MDGVTSTVERELDSQRYVELLQDRTVYRDDIGGLKPDGWEDMSSSYDVVYTYTLYYQGASARCLPWAVIGAIEGNEFNENSEMGIVKTTWEPINEESSHIFVRITRLVTNKVFNVDAGYVSLGATMNAIEQYNNEVIDSIISISAAIIRKSPSEEVGAASPVLKDRARAIKWVASGEMQRKWTEGHKEGELVLTETLRTRQGIETRHTNIDTGEQETSEVKAVDVHLEETGQADTYREMGETEPAPMVDLFEPEYDTEPEPVFDEQPSEDAFTAGRRKGFFSTAVDSFKSIFNSLFRR